MSAATSGIRAVTVGIICALFLSGCENARDAIGISKQSPDEFAVVTRAPLTLPPDYGLRPPKPGAPRPQEVEVKDSARGLLVPAQRRAGGSIETRPAASTGETALLAKAGANDADPGIRRLIDRESSILATEDESFVDSLIFWQKKAPPGEIVDAEKESQRLRENAALGNSPTTGRTPRIERKPKGWLEGLIN